MRLLRIIFSVIAFLASIFAAETHPNPRGTSDQVRSELILGTWELLVSPSGPIVSARFTFQSGGTFGSEGELRLGPTTLRIRLEGKWRIEKGVLIEQITYSSQPEFIRIGSVTKDKILRLEDDTLETRDEDGDIERFKRTKA